VTSDVKKLIHRTSAVAAGISVVLSPIPLLDEVVLLPAYGIFTARIASRHGLGMAQIPWRPIWKSAFAGLLARGVVNIGVAFVPGVSAVAGAATAAALTEIFGHYVDEACREPATAMPLTIRGVIATLKLALKKKKASDAPAFNGVATANG
jgi:uncharacterized protein (DUF697 family)